MKETTKQNHKVIGKIMHMVMKQQNIEFDNVGLETHTPTPPHTVFKLGVHQ